MAKDIKIPRVSFVGNANNEPFRLAHELSRMGVECSVYPLSKQALDAPESLKTLPYYKQTRVRHSYILAEIRPIIHLLNAYPHLVSRIHRVERRTDFLVLNQLAPSLPWTKAKPPHASFLTGSDISTWIYPDRIAASLSDLTMKLSAIVRRDVKKSIQQFARRQSHGIASSSFLIRLPLGVSCAMDKGLEQVGAAAIPSIYGDYGINLETLLDSGSARTRVLDKTMAGAASRQATVPKPLRCLVGAAVDVPTQDRFLRTDFDEKRTDIILNGWSMAVRRGVQGVLQLLRKGHQLGEAEDLIHKLGIENSVQWLNPVPYEDFVSRMLGADVIVDSLGSGALGRISVDALATGIPLVARCDEPQLQSRFSAEMANFWNCFNSEDVCDALQKLYYNRDREMDRGEAAQINAATLKSEEWVAGCLEMIQVHSAISY